MLSILPSQAAWAWDYRSVVLLLKVTADGYGPTRTIVPAQPFNLLFEMSIEEPLPESNAIVFVVDDDVSVREALQSLLRRIDHRKPQWF